MYKFKEKFKITDEDIEEISTMKINFDEERKEIIKCFESCFIEAAPGSGKTTTLVAKLMILIKKLKKNNCEKGICILSHTNVGIEIIKEKLGSEADILFKHPNYLGTLQSFIDKYLTIPCYKEIFNKNIKYIDDDIVKLQYHNLENHNQNLKIFLSKKKIKIEEIWFNFSERKFYRNSSVMLNDSTKESFKKLYERIENGYIKYNEALELAKIYLDKYPKLKNFISERFVFTMVDEMQDTNEEAYYILENIFDRERTIVQYIGDKNQNIMGGNEKWYIEEISKKKLTLNNSKRFGENIAKLLNKITNQKEIRGNPEIDDFKPVLFLYNTLEEENYKVLDKFIEIIKEKGLISQDKVKFKAIGRIGKLNTGKNISSYFKNYLGKNEEDNYSFYNLIRKRRKKESQNKAILNETKKRIELFLKNKGFESNSVQKILENNKTEYYIIIYNYLKNKYSDIVLANEIFDFMKINFELNKQDKEEFLKKFICIKEEKWDNKKNIYSKDGVEVEIGTVHSVKGETHTATLYLETSYYKKYDVSQVLINTCIGILGTDIECNNILYVGCSRPKYLLCIACSKRTIDNDETKKEMLEEIFEIIEI